MATHSSILAWRIPWTEELVGYSPQGGEESDTTEVAKHACTLTFCLREACGCTRVFVPWNRGPVCQKFGALWSEPWTLRF